VPPKPKALTPARRGFPSTCSQGRSSFVTAKGICAKSNCGLGRSKLALSGSTRSCSASTALSKPAAPAALLRWPKLDLTEPKAMLPAWISNFPKISFKLFTSTTSPTLVEVPCPSIKPALAGETPAAFQARSTARCCPKGLGAVMPLPRPSLLAPTPRMTA